MPRYVHDQRVGAGYGAIGGRGLRHGDFMSGARFPYNNDDSEPQDIDDEMQDTKDKIGLKLNFSNIAREPSKSSRRDFFTMSKNRLDLSENDSPRTTLSGMVPFPLQKFTGPAIGGQSDNPSYTVAPGRIDGSPYGWVKGVMTPSFGAEDAPPRFMDAIDPDVRERSRKKLKIARLSA
jgi:hypothetical protein